LPSDHAFIPLHAGRFGVSDMLRQRIDEPHGSPPHYPERLITAAV
jgi:hypothetical protein